MDRAVKTRGKIYTPNFIVENILKLSGYVFGNINKKHVIDNSCGDGAFLVVIVKRYIDDFLQRDNDLIKLKKELETYIHGIEIDGIERNKCILNIQNVCDTYNIKNINVDIVCGNTLSQSQYNGKMDFVLGNPPYVRVHNFGSNYDEFKGFEFAQNGMADLYLVFYEIGIKMLNKNGILSYISPSSFFTSLAGSNFRKWIIKTNKVDSICDLKHFQPFNATTYTAIVTIKNSKISSEIKYYEYNAESKEPILVENLEPNNYLIEENLYFGKKQSLDMLKKILNHLAFGSDIHVKNAFATLADKVFIGNFSFDSKLIIPILKISTGKWSKCIFPYDKNGKIIQIEELKNDKEIYNYLVENKEILDKRDAESSLNWFGFGRTQALADVSKKRVAVNSLFSKKGDVKINYLKPGDGAYSGLYILSPFSLSEIKSALIDDEFIEYISFLHKYKSGGYYTCSSKDIKKYLDYYFYGGKIHEKCG